MLDFFSNIFAQVGADDGLVGLLDYRDLGVLVFFSVALLKMWIVPRGYLDKTEETLKKREQELEDLREKIDSEVLPQLWRTTEILAQFAKVNRDGSQE